MKHCKRILACLLCLSMVASLCVAAVNAQEETARENLIFQNGTLDGILTEGETEKTLNADWTVSYPVATFGNDSGDSPAKIQNLDGNSVLVLEYSTGNFASFFADLSVDHTNVPEGTYELSMDLKPVGEDFTTDNVGFNLYNQYRDVRIYDNGWKNCTELEDGWLHYARTFEISKNSVDSIQMWFNTMGTSTLYVDNLSFKQVETSAAEGEVLRVEYTAKSGTAVTVRLPEAAETVAVAEQAGYVLEAELDYTYADGVITLKNDYADGLASGANRLVVTAGEKEYQIDLVIKQAKPSIPENKDDFFMQETLVGGDFDMFEKDFAFSLEQVEGWGSNVTYDDPGVIVELDGNKVLRLQKDKKTSYSSAFAFMSPTIQSGDTVTLRFDYRLDAKDLSVYQGADINFCFVSASNMQMNLIPLDGSNPAQTRGDGDYQWDVQYTQLDGGWTRVEMTFVANTALLSYNSMRFLLPTDKAQEGDALYIDNVSLVLWAKAEAPVYAGGELAFDKTKPADVYAMVDLQALDPQQILMDGAEVSAANWSVNPAKDTITLSRDYLKTLENGQHTVTVKTAGGECSFSISVSGQSTDVDNTDPAPADNSWIWIAAAVLAVAALAAAAVVLIRKKKA